MRNYIYLMLLVIGTNNADFDPCKVEVITDLSVADCAKEGKFYLRKGNSKHACFPRCLTINGSCFKYQVDDKWKDAIWTPECLIDGTWAPKQCKGESSSKRCFCFDSAGNRIFGQEFYKQNSSMNCACSRKRLELINSGSYFYASLHCDSNGNYEPVQCNAGNCWCVEPTTGEMTSEVVPDTMLKYLRCHASSVMTMGEQYMRQCESQEYAQKKVLHELNIHGTKEMSFEHLLCDADGSYGAFKISNGIASCKWRDNSDLNAAGTVPQPSSQLNCNCARDKKIFENAGLNLGKQCTPLGSYNPIQQLNDGRYYCVDYDGYRISDYMKTIPEESVCQKYLI